MAKVSSWKKLLASAGLGSAAATQVPEEAEAAPINKSLWHATRNLWLPEADVKLWPPDRGTRVLKGANPSMLPAIPFDATLEKMYPLGRFDTNKLLTGEGNITEGAGAYTSDANQMGRRYLRQFSETYDGDEYMDKTGNIMSQKEFNKKYPHISQIDDMDWSNPHQALEQSILDDSFLINELEPPDFSTQNMTPKEIKEAIESFEAYQIGALEKNAQVQEELWSFIDNDIQHRSGIPKDAALYEMKTNLDTDEFVDWNSPSSDPKNEGIMEILRDYADKGEGRWGSRGEELTIDNNPYGNVHAAWDLSQTEENASDIAKDMLSIGKKGVVEWNAGAPHTGHYNVPDANNFVFFDPAKDLKVIDRLSGVDKPRDWEKFIKGVGGVGLVGGAALGGDSSQVQARPLAERQKSQIMTAAPYDSRHAFENWVAENVYSGDSEQAAKTLGALDWTPAAIPIGAGHAINYLLRGQGKDATFESLIAALGPIGAKGKKAYKVAKKKLGY
jgi:hypothetical protein